MVRLCNGIIHHCLDSKSQILKIYLPGNDTPTTNKGYKTRNARVSAANERIYLFESPSVVVVCQFQGRKFL
jgi:hypothetical protein